MTDLNRENSNQPSRYNKQIRFPEIGIGGQEKISSSRVVVVGCGALGSVSANLLARAGVGELVLVDRDFVELDNLQRQVLYHEGDVGSPKAQVAAQRLSQINSDVKIEFQVTDVSFRNIETLFLDHRRADIVVDGTDNFEIRFLINDACVQHKIPWIYGGCLGAEGQTMNILPGQTGCLNCLMLDGPPAPGATATCDSSGVLSTIINVVASYQVNETLKYLSGKIDALSPNLQVFDLWANRTHAINVKNLRASVDCPTCHRHEFHWLSGKRGSQTSILCGRNAVQLSFPGAEDLDLENLADRLTPLGKLESNRFMIRFYVDEFVINVFQDGRAIINGTEDIAQAKKLYSQYIGA